MTNLDDDNDLDIVAKIDGAVHLGQFFIFDKDVRGDYQMAVEKDWKVENCYFENTSSAAGISDSSYCKWKIGNFDNHIEIDGKKLFRDEKAVMAAVNDYYKTMGDALVNDDPAAFEKNYGYLEPTGNSGDGVNGWRWLFDILRPQGVKEYRVSFNEPIVTVAGNTATADLDGVETVFRKRDKGKMPPFPYSTLRNGERSARNFKAVFYLEKERDKWKVTKVDEFTEEEKAL